MGHFAWQDVCGAYTVSRSNIPSVIGLYQQSARASPQEVLSRGIPRAVGKHGIEYDERYSWG